jgi:hypothetical protein
MSKKNPVDKRIKEKELELLVLLGLSEYERKLTRKEKKKFLTLLVPCIPSLIIRTKEKMIETNTRRLYLEKPPKNDNGYFPNFEISSEGKIEFHHHCSYASLEEEGIIKEAVHIQDYINHYPKNIDWPLSENLHMCGGQDILNSDFQTGLEMYKRIKIFLKK